jgi:hypothetical protein
MVNVGPRVHPNLLGKLLPHVFETKDHEKKDQNVNLIHAIVMEQKRGEHFFSRRSIDNTQIQILSDGERNSNDPPPWYYRSDS